MKKIVMGIAAAAMATAMFAGEPAANPSVTSFNGNATVKWGVDLDTNKTGFENSTWNEFKMKLFDQGDKSTSGEGVWAELKIQMNESWNPAWITENGAEKMQTSKVEVAKLHFDNVYVGILSGDTVTGEVKPTIAIKSTDVHMNNVGPAEYTQGIVAGYEDGNLNVAVDFRSDAHYTNNYALAAEVALKDSNEWAAGLEVKAGASYELVKDNTTAWSASAAYKLAIDDKFYLKPQVAVASTVDAKATNLMAAVIYGWGSTGGCDKGVYFLDGWSDNTPGVSVMYKKNLENSDDKGTLNAALWTNDLIENLKAAALCDVNLNTKVTEVKFGMKYDIKADDLTITPKFGIHYGKDVELKAKKDAAAAEYGWVDADKNPSTAPVWGETKAAEAGEPAVIGDVVEVKVGVDVNGLIDNTTFSVEYVSGNLAADPAVKGNVNVGCQIHF